MTHSFASVSAKEARRRHPDAMILRHLGDGRWLAFDTTADAYWHGTAQVDPHIGKPA